MTLAGLTITGGNAADSGGGINNAGSLTVTDCTVSGNTAFNNGGGVSNAGSLTIINSTITGNTADAGGEFMDGGGIYNTGTTTVTNCTISENKAYIGGGIGNDTGTMIVINSTISENEAHYGGGIGNWTGTLTLTDSTIERNTATSTFHDIHGEIFGSGGGIFHHEGTATMTHCVIAGNTVHGTGGGIDAGDTLILTNCVIEENTAKRDGGGISSARTLSLASCVVAGNVADLAGGGIYTSGTSSMTNCTVAGNVADLDGGGICHDNGDLIINNSIIVQNTAAGQGKDIHKNILSLYNPVGSISGEYNLIGYTHRDGFTSNPTGLITLSSAVVGNPKFVAIPATIDMATTGENYNSDDWDLRLQFVSAAINKGNNSLAVDANGQLLTTDLDGNDRIFGGTVDLGAYEYCSIATPPTLHTVESINSSSLAVYWDEVPAAEEYIVQYATDADFLTNAETVKTTTNIKLIYNLSPDTVYYVRVATCDSDGNVASVWSNALEQRTKFIPTNVKATDVTATSIELSWTGVLGAVGYEIQYSLDGGRSWIWGTTSNDTTASVDTLAADSYCLFRVRTMMSEGKKSDWSDKLICKTGTAETAIPAAKPKKVAVGKGADKPTISTLTLSITKNTKLAESGNTVSYIVFCTSNLMLKFSYTITGDKVFIEGLQPGTKYTFAVHAIHTNGNVSEAVSVKATTAKYTAVKSLKKTATTTNSVTLSWKPSTAPAQTTGYVIEVYDSTGKNRLAIAVPPITDINITTATIPGLDAGTKYTFVVKATDGVFESIAAKIKVATMKA